MSTVHAISARLSAVLFVLLFCSTAFAGSAKINVCHIPPGNPENFHTIKISEKALAAHVSHGDLVGACEAGCAVLCNDGDACTVDDTGDCYANGCPIDRAPTDCDDSLACTSDSCNSVQGCVYEAVVYEPSDLCQVAACVEPNGDLSETPKECDGDQVCDLSTGNCVDPKPTDECPCFSLSDLGTPSYCIIDFAPESASEIGLPVTVGGIACSGVNCADAGNPGCYIGEDTNPGVALTAQQDQACRTVLASACSQ